MRIIAGTLKGRRLAGPGRAPLRPTSDRLRETLFNVLGDRVRDARVLDAFAGTGAVGLEALSRRAAHVTFVEQDRAALAVLDSNILALGVGGACVIIRHDFLGAAVAPGSGVRALPGPFEIAFLDPPYDFDDLAVVLERTAALVVPGGLVVLEHASRRVAPDEAGAVRRYRLLEAGDSALSFYTAL